MKRKVCISRARISLASICTKKSHHNYLTYIASILQAAFENLSNTIVLFFLFIVSNCFRDFPAMHKYFGVLYKYYPRGHDVDHLHARP